MQYKIYFQFIWGVWLFLPVDINKKHIIKHLFHIFLLFNSDVEH